MANSNLQDGSTAVLPSSPSSPPRSTRRQIRRAITELSPPGKVNLHSIQHEPAHHPIQNRHHLQHRHHRKHVSQDARRAQVDDPKHLIRHSIDMGRSSISQQGLGSSPMPSRRTSVLIQKEEEFRLGASIQESKASKEEKLREAQKKADHRADGLKESLVNLHDFAVDSTKRLDETYYSVLEKMDALQSTITALKNLADTSHDIYGTFEKDSRDLEHEIVSQIGALGRFEDQQSKIESLRGRIESGRKRIGVLSQRVDVVRERVQGWEEADREWQEKTRKKMKLIWSTTMVIVLAVVILFIGMKRTLGDAISHEEAMPAHSAPERSSRLPNTSKPLGFTGKLGQLGARGDVRDTTARDDIADIQETLDGRRRTIDGERLRALDELDEL